MELSEVRPSTDMSPAAWLSDLLPQGGPEHVDRVVPLGYEAYVEISLDEDGSTLWAVRDVLARRTDAATPCWFAVWEGWPLPGRWRGAPTFTTPEGQLLLFAGAFRDLDVIAIEFACAVTEWGGSGSVLHRVDGGAVTAEDHRYAAQLCRERANHLPPSLWWPDDRPWVTGRHVDSDCLHLACSPDVAADVLAISGITARGVRPDETFHVDEY